MGVVERLHTVACPSATAHGWRLSRLVTEAGETASVQLATIDHPRQAQRERLFGSQTMGIDGSDVDPHAGQRRGYWLNCRMHTCPDGLHGVSPDEWVLTVLRSTG